MYYLHFVFVGSKVLIKTFKMKIFEMPHKNFSFRKP